MTITKPHLCPPDGTHQVFRIVTHKFCVTTALALIEADAPSAVAERGDVDVTTLSHSIRLLQPKKPDTLPLFAIDVDPEHAMTTDLTKPLLIAPLLLDSGGTAGNALIDGWHRVYKAHMEGIDTLPAILLSESAARAARLPQFI